MSVCAFRRIAGIAGLLVSTVVAAESTSPEQIIQQSRAKPGKLGQLNEKACRQLTGWKGRIEDRRCFVHWAGRGRAAAIVVPTECGGDSCSTHTWAFTRTHARVRLPDAEGGNIEILPKRNHVLYDKLATDKYPPTKVIVVSTNLNQPKRSRSFADCMSPVMSPGEKWIVCRNRRGDILRVPVHGGAPKLLHKAHWKEEYVPHATHYPGAVWFTSRTSMKVPRPALPPIVLKWSE